VDNGSGPEAKALMGRLNIDNVVLFRQNKGIAQAWNALVYGACRAPYILTLEDDWVADANWDARIRVLDRAMAVLETDDKVCFLSLALLASHSVCMHIAGAGGCAPRLPLVSNVRTLQSK
jgi:hypothetical protein